jgi:hypothetical protein
MKILLFIILLNQIKNINYTPITNTDTSPTTNNSGMQDVPSVATLSNSYFVISWATFPVDNYDIFAQIFDNTFQKTGTDLTITASNSGDQFSPIILDLKNNKMVISWDDWTNDRVKFRLFDYNVIPLGGEVVASTVSSSDGDLKFNKAAVNSNGDFVLTWQINTAAGKTQVRAAFYDINGNPLTSDILISTSNTVVQSLPAACALLNGNFIIVFQNKNLGNFDVYYTIYDKNGIPLKGQTIASVNTTGNQTVPYCVGLLSGGFVVSFATTIWGNNYDIAFTMFMSDGTSLNNNEVKINTLITDPITSLSALPSGGFVVGYDCNDDSCIQVYEYDGTSAFAETRINNYIPKHQGYTRMASFDNGGFVAVWISDNGTATTTDQDIEYQVFNFIGDCYSFQVQIGINALIQIKFNNLNTNSVRIYIFPTIGTLSNASLSTLDSTTFYDKNNIYYKKTTTSDDSFYYKASKGDIPCKINVVNLSTCYTSCYTCTSPGTIENHNCSSCNSTYYALFDIGSQCYKSSEIVIGYYFEPTMKIFINCYKSCASCLSGGNDNKHNCTTCALGHYPLSDNPTQCYTILNIPYDYIFNDNMLVRCDSSCNSCNEIATNCINCNYNDRYYPLIDDKSKCYRDLTPPDYYYFDESRKAFQKCYSSCKTCTGYKDIYDQLCILCKENYYLLIDKPSNCFGSDEKIDGYFFDYINNIFNKCFESCLTCKGAGDLANPNCIACKDYQSCDPCGGIIYNSQCITSCPNGTIYDEKENTCYECKAKNLFSYNGNCLSICPPGYYENNFTCFTCQSDNKLVYMGTCINKCPLGYFQDIQGICTKINNTICSNNICQNAGQCITKYNKITCICDKAFTGQFCQLVNDPTTLAQYLSIYI